MSPAIYKSNGGGYEEEVCDSGDGTRDRDLLVAGLTSHIKHLERCIAWARKDDSSVIPQWEARIHQAEQLQTYLKEGNNDGHNMPYVTFTEVNHAAS